MSSRIVLGMSLIGFTLFAVFATASIAGPGNQSGRPFAFVPLSLSWTTEPWTGDDRPYQAIRAEIDSLAAGNKLTDTLIEQYRREAPPKCTDPQALFRLAYACYRMQKAHPQIYSPYSIRGDAFYFAPSPHTYNYDRLRFLASAVSPGGPNLVALGRRLLQHNPNDRDVRYWLVGCYRPGLSAEEEKEALVQAQDYLHRYPGTPAAYADLASVYFSAWIARRNPADGQKAIAAYQEYLRLGPPSPEWRAQVQKIIHVIEETPMS